MTTLFEQSILTSVKKLLGIDETYTVFDVDIVASINSAFVTLNQLGLGPEEGFMIEDKEAQWGAFLGDDIRLNNVRTYIQLRVRLIFDPPQTSYLIEAVNKQVSELEWRLNVYREDTAWIDPNILTA